MNPFDDLAWYLIDSGAAWTRPYRGDGWAALRGDQCVALNSQGDRCSRLVPDDAPLCHHHLGKLAKYMMVRLEERAIKQAARQSPEVFRFLVNASREEDVLRQMQETGAVVYFLAVEDIVKIGFSTNATARVAALRAGGKTLIPDGYDIKKAALLGTTPGGRALEGRLHHVLRDHRVRGEWFVRSPLVNEAIAYFLEGTPAPLLEAELREFFDMTDQESA